MANNKVKLSDGTVLLDLTADTVTADAVIAGRSLHLASGEAVTGTLEFPVTSVNGKTGAVTLTAEDIGVSGGSGEQHFATLTAANWYQQTPDSNEEFWYAYDITPTEFDSTTQDVIVTAANADTYDWLLDNAYYEVAVTSTKFSIQAKEKPAKTLQVFYELKTRSDS